MCVHWLLYESLVDIGDRLDILSSLTLSLFVFSLEVRGQRVRPLASDIHAASLLSAGNEGSYLRRTGRVSAGSQRHQSQSQNYFPLLS